LPSDSIDVPRDIQALATAIDADLGPSVGADPSLVVSGYATATPIASGHDDALVWGDRTSGAMGPVGPAFILRQPGAYLVTATITGPVMPGNKFVRVTILDDDGPIAAGFVPPGETRVSVSTVVVFDGMGTNSLRVAVRNPHSDATFDGRITVARVGA
jgi:hypothetical protein